MQPAVVIVDDVDDLLHLMAEAVTIVCPQYEVFTASSGTQARATLARLRDEGRELRMLIADQSLGDLTGLQLLAETKPTGARLILVTGRATSVIETAAAELGAAVLWKPFRLRDLLTLLSTEVPDDQEDSEVPDEPA